MKKFLLKVIVINLLLGSIMPIVSATSTELTDKEVVTEQIDEVISEVESTDDEKNNEEVEELPQKDVIDEKNTVLPTEFDLSTVNLDLFEASMDADRYLNLSMKVSNEAGEAEVRYISYIHDYSGEVVNLYLEKDETTGEYHLPQKYDTYKSMFQGEWIFFGVYLIDTFGNELHLNFHEHENYFLEEVREHALSTIIMNIPIENLLNELDLFVEEMSISKQVLKNGESTEVTVKLNISLYQPYLEIVYKEENTGNSQWVTLTPTEDPLIYKGEFTLSEYVNNDSYWVPEYLITHYKSSSNKYSSERADFNHSSYYGIEILTNDYPIIRVADTVQLLADQEVDIYSLFSVYDLIDGDISSTASVQYPSQIDWTDRGWHEITISVRNSRGNISTKTFHLHLIKPEILEINISRDKTGPLKVGESDYLETALIYTDMDYPDDFKPTWISSDPSIVSVDEEGNLEALSVGNTFVTAYYQNIRKTILIEVVDDGNVEAINGNQTVMNSTINHDIYISDYSEITLKNVTINGDIYVDGILYLNNSIVNGTVYVDYINQPLKEYDKFSYIIYDKESTVQHTDNFKNREDILINLVNDTGYITENKLYIKGHSFVDYWISDYPDYYSYKPTGHAGNIDYREYTGDKEHVYLNYYSRGERFSKKIPVKKLYLDDTGEVKYYPHIQVRPIEIVQGSEFKIEKFISATDVEDGDISKDIVIIESNIDTSEQGYYTLKLSVTDHDGLTTYAGVEVSVVSTWFGLDLENLTYLHYLNKSYSGTAKFNGTPDIERINWSFEDPSIANISFSEADMDEDGSFQQNFTITPKKRGETFLYVSRGDTEYVYSLKVIDPKVIDFTLPKENIIIPLSTHSSIYIPEENILKQDIDYIEKVFTTESDAIEISGNTIEGIKEGNGKVTVAIGGVKKEIKVSVLPQIAYSLRLNNPNYSWYRPSWATQYNYEPIVNGDTDYLSSGFNIKLINSESNGDFTYQVYFRDKGWSDEVGEGKEIQGTNSDIMEAVKVNLRGEISEKYSLYYRVHMKERGWLGWTENGNKTGAIHVNDNINDFQAILVAKGEDSPELSAKPLIEAPNLNYSSHVQSLGWQMFVRDGQMSGTERQSKRLEGIKINLSNNMYEGTIEYQTHVQSYGWMDWVGNGEISGTEGEAKRLEGIRIRLTGELLKEYDIYYRVHAETYGWLDWAKNGESSGTEGLAKRLEAIEIKLVRKDDPAPGKTTRPYVISNPTIFYKTHVQKFGWQEYVQNGVMSGTSERALRLEGIQINVSDPALWGGVQYRTHVQKVGWQGWKSNDQMSGTEGRALRLEAIEIKLTGSIAQYYDVYYRVHSQTYGWIGWAKNGQPAGTEGKSKRLEGIEIQLVQKGGRAPGKVTGAFIK